MLLDLDDVEIMTDKSNLPLSQYLPVHSLLFCDLYVAK